VSRHENLTTFYFSSNFFFPSPKKFGAPDIGKRGGKTNTGLVTGELIELGVKGKKTRTVQTDFRERLLDTTMIDLMWAKQTP
jgi:hypothetical protein